MIGFFKIIKLIILAFTLYFVSVATNMPQCGILDKLVENAALSNYMGTFGDRYCHCLQTDCSI